MDLNLIDHIFHLINYNQKCNLVCETLWHISSNSVWIMFCWSYIIYTIHYHDDQKTRIIQYHYMTLTWKYIPVGMSGLDRIYFQWQIWPRPKYVYLGEKWCSNKIWVPTVTLKSTKKHVLHYLCRGFEERCFKGFKLSIRKLIVHLNKSRLKHRLKACHKYFFSSNTKEWPACYYFCVTFSKEQYLKKKLICL